RLLDGPISVAVFVAYWSSPPLAGRLRPVARGRPVPLTFGSRDGLDAELRPLQQRPFFDPSRRLSHRAVAPPVGDPPRLGGGGGAERTTRRPGGRRLRFHAVAGRVAGRNRRPWLGWHDAGRRRLRGGFRTLPHRLDRLVGDLPLRADRRDGPVRDRQALG